jgi:hypothetical protein
MALQVLLLQLPRKRSCDVCLGLRILLLQALQLVPQLSLLHAVCCMLQLSSHQSILQGAPCTSSSSRTRCSSCCSSRTQHACSSSCVDCCCEPSRTVRVLHMLPAACCCACCCKGCSKRVLLLRLNRLDVHRLQDRVDMAL